jgi:hypothetical protein
MNTRDNTPKSDLPPDVQAELLRRVQNLPNEVLIDSDKAFEELQRRARERSNSKPA